MPRAPESVTRFLAGKRIAVAGVSRHSGHPGNAVFLKLLKSGYEVFPVNPNAAHVEGERCYRDIGSLPVRVDGLVIATPPNAAGEMVRQCVEAGVRRIWFHRSFGSGSVSAEAVKLGSDKGIDCIVGGCPLMFCEPVDPLHRCMRWWLQRTGRVPR